MAASNLTLMPRPARPRAAAHQSAGFTLLEVMVSLAILGLALTAIMSVQAGLYNSNLRARNITIATSTARCKITEVEEQLLKDGYSENERSEDGPCCAGESPPGISCKWLVERVVLPDPPPMNLGGADGGTGASGGDPASSGGGLGPLGALASAASNPSALADGGLGGLTQALSQGTGPNGQTGVNGMAGMAMTIVYPSLRPLLEASIRRVTVNVTWKEGTAERSVKLVEFVTNPQRGLPPVDPAAAAGGASPTSTSPIGTGVTPPTSLMPGLPGVPR